MDRFFRAQDPEHEVKVYGIARLSIERVNSKLKDLICLNGHHLRGLSDIVVHTALSVIMLVIAVAALRRGVPEKARCIAFFRMELSRQKDMI